MAELSPLKIMQTFTIKNIPDLDVCVLAALELLSSQKLPFVKIPFKKPLVVGSGNAIATGKIIFEDALFADESTVDKVLSHAAAIDGVILISASGAKHAPIIAKKAREKKKKVVLLTNTSNSEAEKYAERAYIFPKNREPYTYNTSSYLGLILSHTQEKPRRILEFIRKEVDKVGLPDFSAIRKYYLIIPEEFAGVIRLLQVKFIELFGRKIARDIETFEYVPHATTVVPSEELFITFGRKMNPLFGENQLLIPLPKNADYGTMMAIGYYVVGKIQQAQPPWFKQNIENYMKKASQAFGRQMDAIVE